MKPAMQSSPAWIRWRLLLLTAVPASSLLFGCRHGNAINFVTNTQFGLKVGVNAEKIPEVQIGYNRQEAARVPVFHETKNSSIPGSIDSADVEKLKYVAKISKSGKSESEDAYSVLGTFSGQASGGSSGNSGNGTGNVRIGQYFSTGIAAQLLAKTGGAALVNPAVTANAPVEALSVADAEKAKADGELHEQTRADQSTEIANFVFNGTTDAASRRTKLVTLRDKSPSPTDRDLDRLSAVDTVEKLKIQIRKLEEDDRQNLHKHIH